MSRVPGNGRQCCPAHPDKSKELTRIKNVLILIRDGCTATVTDKNRKRAAKYPAVNIHAPSAEIRERFRCLDFRGHRFTRKSPDGQLKTYIRCVHRTLHCPMLYCFEEDFAWFAESVPTRRFREAEARRH